MNRFPPFDSSKLEKTGNPQRVVIVGAGLAGMSAALRLQQAGHDVTVLEKAVRPGGRVLTFRNMFSDGLHVEAGAAFLMGQHTYTMGFIKELGLEPLLRPIKPKGDATIFDRHIDQAIPCDGGPLDPTPPGLWPSEQDTGPHAWLENALGGAAREFEAYGDPRAPGWPPPGLAKFDNATLEQLFIAGNALGTNEPPEGMSATGFDILRRGYVDLMGDGPSSTAALEMLRDLTLNHIVEAADGPRFSLNHASLRAYASVDERTGGVGHATGAPHPGDNNLVNGNDEFVAAFGFALGSALVREVEVTEISFTGTEGTVTGADGRSWTGDHVICAVPVPALKQIAFEPTLPDEQRRALDLYLPTRVTRVYVEFDQRFWVSKGRSGIANTDLPEPLGGQSPDVPGMWINNQTSNQAGTAGVIECYVAGHWADVLAGMSGDRQHELALVQIGKVFGGAGMYSTGRWATHHWPDAYAWFAPGTMSQALHHGGKSFGRLHFAGDQYSVLPGWTQGALESGVAAARAVNEAAAHS